MNVLFYASGELKLSDECIFGLASWQHHTSVTLQCACVPPPVHCSPFLGRTSHLTATPCFLSAKMQNCEQTLQVEIYNHTWSVFNQKQHGELSDNQSIPMTDSPTEQPTSLLSIASFQDAKM